MQVFVGNVARLRASLPALHRSTDMDAEDSAWYGLDGQPMSEDEWNNPDRPGVALWIAATGAGGNDRDVLLIMNPDPRSASFTIPADRGNWELRLDTSKPDGTAIAVHRGPREALDVPAEALLVATSP
jgi:glycogen operon protein